MSPSEREVCIKYFNIKPEELKTERNKMMNGKPSSYKGGCNCGSVKVNENFIDDYLNGGGYTLEMDTYKEDTSRMSNYARKKRYYCGGTTDIVHL